LDDREFVAYLRDKEAIESLVNRYAVALDERQWALLTDLFTTDVEADYGGICCSGINALVEMIQSHLGGCGPSQHLFGNLRVQVDGDTATALFYGRVMHAGLGEQREVVFDFWGEYRDELQRTPEGWRTSRRTQRPFHITGDMSILKPG
jgi:hypothetical protein